MAQEDGAAPTGSAIRRQVALRAVDLETLVADEHRVRLVWSFVEGLVPDLSYDLVDKSTVRAPLKAGF